MRLILLLLTLSALPACNHLAIKRGENTIRPTAQEVEAYLYSFGWGFIPGKKLPPESELCPSGRIEALTMRMSGTDVLIATATLGIFVPHRADVSCSKSGPAY